MRFVRAHGGQVAFMVGLGLLGLLVGLFIFANQNVTPPSWAPIVGKDHYRLDARFESANGVMPGQGQAVTIAGVDVGKVESVRLDRGQAVVRLRLEKQYGSRVHPDATVLLRPKTPLKDMVVELEPGTKDSGPALKNGSTTLSQKTVSISAGGTVNTKLSASKLKKNRSAKLKLTAVATSGKEKVTKTATVSVSKK